MTKRFEDLVNELYKELLPLNIKNFYIEPLYLHTNKDSVITVADLNDLERALKVLFTECASSIDDISLSFKIYNDSFEGLYFIDSPYTEEFNTLVEDLFENNNIVKKELKVKGLPENSEWNPVLEELEHYHNVKINKVEEENLDTNDNVDFSNYYVCIDYNYEDNLGEKFEETAFLSKLDLLIMSAILPFKGKNDIVVLCDLSLDAQNLLKRIFWVENVFVLDPFRDMTSHIASKANVIICNYNHYRWINTWKLNKDTTLVDLTFGHVHSDLNRNYQISNPLKDKHYDNIDILYHTNSDNEDDIATKMLIKLWEETQPIKDNN